MTMENLPDITLLGCLSGIIIFISTMTLSSNIRPIQRYLETDVSVFQHRTGVCLIWIIVTVGIFSSVSVAFDNGIAFGLLQSLCLGLGFALRDILSNVFAWFYLWYAPWATRQNKLTLIHSAFVSTDVEGTLHTIDTFTSTLKTSNGLIIVPNRYFLSGIVRHSNKTTTTTNL